MTTEFLARWNPENLVSPADPDRARRVRETENALLSLRFGGHRLSALAQRQLARYVRGEISRKEAFTDLYGLGSASQEAELWASKTTAAATGRQGDLKTDSQWPG